MKCRALVFSGQKNPEWKVKEAVAVQIMEALKKVKPAQGNMPEFVLGYSGCELETDNNFTYRIFNGVIQSTSSPNEKHADEERKMEIKLLQSAPATIAGILTAAGAPAF